MELKSKVFYNTLVQVIGKGASIFLGLLSVALITRALGQSGFGAYTTIITFLSFFAVLADLGLTLVTVQIISRPGQDQDQALANLFALRLLSALVFLAAAPLIVYLFPYDQAIKTGVLIGAIGYLFNALNQVLIGLFQKELRLDKVAIAETAGRIVLVVLVFLAVLRGWGLTGIVAATAVGSGTSFLLSYLFARSYARLRLAYDPALWREIFVRAWPLAITIAFNLIYLRADVLLLSLLSRETGIGYLAEVGLYGSAYRVIDVLITLPFMFAGVVLPIMTRYWADGGREQFDRLVGKAFDAMAIIAWPIVIGAQFTATEIMVAVAGPDFAPAGPILQVLILAVAAIFPGTIFAHAVIAIDRQRTIIPAYIFTALTALLGYFLLIPAWSYWGAAAVTIYSEIAIAVASYWVARKHAAFRLRLSIAARAGAAAGVMGLLLYLFPEAGLALKLIGGTGVYLAALLLFGGLDRRELRALIAWRAHEKNPNTIS